MMRRPFYSEEREEEGRSLEFPNNDQPADITGLAVKLDNLVVVIRHFDIPPHSQTVAASLKFRRSPDQETVGRSRLGTEA